MDLTAFEFPAPLVELWPGLETLPQHELFPLLLVGVAVLLLLVLGLIIGLIVRGARQRRAKRAEPTPTEVALTIAVEYPKAEVKNRPVEQKPSAEQPLDTDLVGLWVPKEISKELVAEEAGEAPEEKQPRKLEEGQLWLVEADADGSDETGTAQEHRSSEQRSSEELKLVAMELKEIPGQGSEVEEPIDFVEDQSAVDRATSSYDGWLDDEDEDERSLEESPLPEESLPEPLELEASTPEPSPETGAVPEGFTPRLQSRPSSPTRAAGTAPEPAAQPSAAAPLKRDRAALRGLPPQR